MAEQGYGGGGWGGEGCERMPNQLKPKKLDLPHLHPCSHPLQKTLQGRFGKAKHTAARRMEAQPGNRQGRAAVSVKGERGHFMVAVSLLSNADLYQHGSLHPAKQSDLEILNPPSPSSSASPTSHRLFWPDRLLVSILPLPFTCLTAPFCCSPYSSLNG